MKKSFKSILSVILATLLIPQIDAICTSIDKVAVKDNSTISVDWKKRLTTKLKEIATNKKVIAGVAIPVTTVATLTTTIALNRKFNRYSELLPEINNENILQRKLQIHVLNVGRADCILIKYGEWTCLVDGGNIDWFRPTDVVKYLESLGIKKLDVLVLTHPHFDHFGQMDEVIEGFNIDRFIYSESGTDFINSCGYEDKVETPLKKKNIQKEKIEAGRYIINQDGFKIQAIGPTKLHNDINDNSMVLLLTYEGKKILLMGDAGVESEKEIMDYCRENNIDISNVDAMKIGHHGNGSSSSKEFVNLVHPEVVLNSTGKQNVATFNLINLHEYPWIMKRYKDVGSKIYTTEEQGTIIVSLNKTNKILEYNRARTKII